MNISRTRALGRATTAVVAGAGVVALAGPASAHVTVQPSSAPKGGYGTISFKVPNEEENADTTKLQVFFPTDRPLASVAVQPVPGWTATVTKVRLAHPITTDDGQVTEAVASITWSGGRIAPGQFQQFPVSMGPLPTGAASLTFKALQTYGKDQVVRWIDVARPGAAAPAHPAPVLTLTAVGAGDGAAGTAASAGADGTAPAGGAASVRQTAANDDTDTTARVLGVAGIVLGAGGVAFGVMAGRRRSGGPAA